MKIKMKVSREIFNEAYYPYLQDYSRRYEVYYGGGGSGKSVFIAQKLVVKALKRVRCVLICRKVMATQKDSCWQLIINTLSNFHILDKCKVNKSNYTIELPNGSLFLFKGLDDEEKIKSIVGITDIWCEEATEFTEQDVTQLDLRLRADAPDLQFIYSFNPVSKANYVYRKWFAKEALVGEDTLIVKTTFEDNRFLPESYVKALQEMQKTNPTYFKIYALGEFCSLDKLVFNNWRVEDFNHAQIQGELAIGMDFGFVNDISTIVASIVNEAEKTIYVFKTWGDKGRTNEELARVIDSLGFRKSVIFADCAEPKSIEEIKRNGITRIKPCVKGKDSIIHGIQKIQQYKLVIHPSCEGIITELENYAWKKDRESGEYINTPIDEFNHYIDALRYSIQDVNRKIKTINKIALGL